MRGGPGSFLYYSSTRAHTRCVKPSETYVRVQLSWPAAQSNRIAELAIATVLGYFLYFYMLPTVTMLWVGYYYHGQYLCKHALESGFARLVHYMVMLLLVMYVCSCNN